MAKELLFSLTAKDFRVDTFRSGGKGGQHQNKTESGVRITHIESGAVGESREERSQHQNKKIALQRLVASSTFQAWHKRKCAELVMALEGRKEYIDAAVDRAMDERNLRIETGDGERWRKEDDGK